MLGRVHEIGSHASDWLARLFGHSLAQIAVALVCVVWMWSGGSGTDLSNVMSVGCFLLAQIILNQQRRREMALQLKLDELVISHEGARDEIAGAENRTESEIRELTAGR